MKGNNPEYYEGLRFRYGRLVSAVVAGWLICCAALSGHAVELWSDEDSGRRADLRATLKLTGFASQNPDDPWLYPDSTNTTGLLRTRFGVNLILSERVTAELAYEHHARRASHGGGLSFAGNIVSSITEAPWRLAPLNWQIARDGDTFEYRHEIDRALVTIQPEWGTITAGRQAIGFGRGVLFSAVDVFAPFSPLEVDREWRRGVDALRIEYRTTPLSALELTAVFGERWEDSALLARFRGYLGEVDGELIAGKRGEDEMLAATFSAALGGAAVHGEAAVFHTPEEQPYGSLFGKKDLVAKLVLGSSYTFNVGNGLTVLGEYHYSGFGLKDAENAIRQIRNEAFIMRYLRGDSQILGQHALALQASYPFNETLLGSWLVLGSLGDGSGMLVPSLVWSATQSTTVTLSAFLPWGPSPKNGNLRSEYGSSPLSLFAQLSVYF